VESIVGEPTCSSDGEVIREEVASIAAPRVAADASVEKAEARHAGQEKSGEGICASLARW
jgi:hypothetical protein